MRIGIIGLGRIGTFHAATLAGLDAVESLVVTDPLAGAARVAAERFGAEAAASPEAMLTAGVDGVVIAAATDAHPRLILAAVEAGVPVFCEKPVARTMKEGADVLRAVRDRPAEIQIGYNRRFDAGFAAARAAVIRGELGPLHTVRSTTLDPEPPPAAYVAVSGGIFRDCAVHDLDIADAGDADSTAAILTLDDDTLAVVSNTRYNGRGYDVRMELHGFTDSIAVGLDDKLPLRSAEPGAVFPAGPPHHFFMDRFAASYRAELAAFIEVVAGGQPSPCTVADALEAGWIAEACTLSLREHRPVQLDEVRAALRAGWVPGQSGRFRPLGLPPGVSIVRLANHALWTIHSAGMAAGSGRHRTFRSLGDDARRRAGRRGRAVRVGLGLRPLPHRSAAYGGGHARGVDADGGAGRGDRAGPAGADVHVHGVPESRLPGQGRGHHRRDHRRPGRDGHRRRLVRARMASLRLRLPECG
jgi:myo-inositol 2-dehydrogenase/D-chiro-inositol 1-dehydrogenase